MVVTAGAKDWKIYDVELTLEPYPFGELLEGEWSGDELKMGGLQTMIGPGGLCYGWSSALEILLDCYPYLANPGRPYIEYETGTLFVAHTDGSFTPVYGDRRWLLESKTLPLIDCPAESINQHPKHLQRNLVNFTGSIAYFNDIHIPATTRDELEEIHLDIWTKYKLYCDVHGKDAISIPTDIPPVAITPDELVECINRVSDVNNVFSAYMTNKEGYSTVEETPFWEEIHRAYGEQAEYIRFVLQEIMRPTEDDLYDTLMAVRYALGFVRTNQERIYER